MKKIFGEYKGIILVVHLSTFCPCHESIPHKWMNQYWWNLNHLQYTTWGCAWKRIIMVRGISEEIISSIGHVFSAVIWHTCSSSFNWHAVRFRNCCLFPTGLAKAEHKIVQDLLTTCAGQDADFQRDIETWDRSLSDLHRHRLELVGAIHWLSMVKHSMTKEGH